MRKWFEFVLLTGILLIVPFAFAQDDLELIEFSVPAGAHPHDVAPSPDGSIA